MKLYKTYTYKVKGIYRVGIVFSKGTGVAIRRLCEVMSPATAFGIGRGRVNIEPVRKRNICLKQHSYIPTGPSNLSTVQRCHHLLPWIEISKTRSRLSRMRGTASN